MVLSINAEPCKAIYLIILNQEGSAQEYRTPKGSVCKMLNCKRFSTQLYRVPIVYILPYSYNLVSIFGVDIDILSYSHIYVSTSCGLFVIPIVDRWSHSSVIS
jgi:hypothetical protein